MYSLEQGMLPSTLMTVAGLLAAVSSIGMGILTSETIQVGLYSTGLHIGDTLKSRIPSWLVYADPGMDIPIDFLTDGPVVDSIIKATLAAEEQKTRAEPHMELIKTIENTVEGLEQLQHTLQIATRTAWQSLEGSKWRKKYIATLHAALLEAEYTKPWSFWGENNGTRIEELRGNITRFEAAEIDDVLYAYTCPILRREVEMLVHFYRNAAERGDVGIRIHVEGTKVYLVPNPVEASIQAEFARVEMRLAATNRTGTILRVLEYKLKEVLILSPRIDFLRNAIRQERALSSFQEYKSWEQKRESRIINAGAHLLQDPAAEAEFETFLTNLLAWGFDFPDDIRKKVLGPRRLTRRDLERRLAIAQYTRAPNLWITLFIVSMFLGFLGFAMGVCYNLAFILNMGILGTTRNCVAILYVRSEQALMRARLEGLQQVQEQGLTYQRVLRAA